jgi:glycosyltransferase involved in cell wall biosynthesis
LQTSANVLWLGRLGFEEIALRMADAAVFVSPARYEPFGLAILEAALSDCALILGDIPTLRELWDGAAIFVNPDDENSLRDALDLLLGDPELAAALGGRARERAGSYGSARMADTYLDAYESLVAGHVAPTAPLSEPA